MSDLERGQMRAEDERYWTAFRRALGNDCALDLLRQVLVELAALSAATEEELSSSTSHEMEVLYGASG